MTSYELFNEWSTYGRVVAHDCMHHRDFFAALSDELRGLIEDPLSILDLGCGDALPVVDLFQNFEVVRYVGIDQSEAALTRARATLTDTGVRFSLRHGTLLDELRELKAEFNVIVGSYSLHHLNQTQKREVLGGCRRVLKCGGLLAVIDVFLQAGESRETYVRRWEEHAPQTFRALHPEEIRELQLHLRASDFPETVATYRQLGEAEGFRQVRSVKQDAQQLFQLVVLS